MAEKEPLMFISFPVSYKMMGEEVNKLIAAYQSKEIGEDVLRQTAQTWKANTPNLLFEKDGSGALSKSLMRHIGTRRGRILLWALNS